MNPNAFVFALVTFPLLASPASAQSPPTFGGRTFDSWRQLVVSDLDPDTRFRGMLAIGHLGRSGHRESAMQAFQEALAEEPVPLVRSAGYLSLLPYGEEAWPILSPGLSSSDREERRIALYAVADFFAPPPLPAAERQLAALPTGDDLPAASQLPERLAPVLVEIFQDRRRDVRDREAAARALGGLFQTHPRQSVADSVREGAMQVAQAADVELACSAIDLIGALGENAKPAVPWLIEVAKREERARPPRDAAQLPDSEPLPLHSRPMAAVEALGNLGAVAGEAIPVLEQLQDRKRGREVYTAGLARRALAEIRAAVATKREN